jgi:hypothetical protein
MQRLVHKNRQLNFEKTIRLFNKNQKRILFHNKIFLLDRCQEYSIKAETKIQRENNKQTEEVIIIIVCVYFVLVFTYIYYNVE